MDENFDDKAEELADDAAQAAEDAAENLTQATENVWDKVEDTTEQVGEQVSQVAETGWDKVEETAEAVEEQTSQVAETAWDKVEEVHAEASETIEETVETVSGTWSEVGEESAGAKPAHEHTYGDEYVPDKTDECCQPDAAPDPVAAAEFASSPIGLGPDLIGPTITAQDVRAIKSDHIIDSQKKARKEKDFPVWAIILIILLVLCICVILPVLLVFGGGIAIFRNMFESLGLILPYLV